MSQPLRLAFMGTPDFSIPALQALLTAGHDVVRVYSQPPRPAGRGQKERLSPVHSFALEQAIEVRTPLSFQDDTAINDFASLQLDAAVVVAYGLILPQKALSAPKLGCLNIHASLLPRWRGAAPIQRAIEAGDQETGVAIMQMERELDTGPIFLSKPCPITVKTTAPDLHDQLSAMGGAAIVEALEGLIHGKLVPQKQATEGVTYAARLKKAESQTNWHLSAREIDRKLRALSPWPGMRFTKDGSEIKLLEASLVEDTALLTRAREAKAGEVIAAPLIVACGEGALSLERLQRAGRSPVAVEAFLNGYSIAIGTVLSSGPGGSSNAHALPSYA